MKLTSKAQFRCVCLAAGVLSFAHSTLGQDRLVNPARGGGLDTNAPMIHIDLFYDYTANQMHATVDTSKGIPKLKPLPPGYAFLSSSNYSVLSGKAYNFQYAWNPGAAFAPPAGAALWIECVNASPGLEVYDGPGNKMENPPRSYCPIFGTAGASPKWAWYGRMAHNSYAVLNPSTNVVRAEYRIYFGDAQTGARETYAAYGDASVQLTWTVDLPMLPVFQFGVTRDTEAGPLSFVNASQYVAAAEAVVNLQTTTNSAGGLNYETPITFTALPATASHGGPLPNHAGLGSRLELELVSLLGPSRASLRFWEAGEGQPQFSLATGESVGVNGPRIVLSESVGAPQSDPYGSIQGRRLAVDQAGLYTVAFRVVDSSTNGPGGGPIHSSSLLYQVYLQAGLTIASLTRQGMAVTAAYGDVPGQAFYLQRSSILGSTMAWETVAGPLPGTGHLQTLTDAAATSGQCFYRLRIIP